MYPAIMLFVIVLLLTWLGPSAAVSHIEIGLHYFVQVNNLIHDHTLTVCSVQDTSKLASGDAKFIFLRVIVSPAILWWSRSFIVMLNDVFSQGP